MMYELSLIRANAVRARLLAIAFGPQLVTLIASSTDTTTNGAIL